MHPVRALTIYLGAVFLGAAVLAPWIWHGIQSLSSLVPALERTAGQPFHRYVNRCLLVLALGGLWPLMRCLRVSSPTDMGWESPGNALRPVFQGAALGFLTLGIIAAVAVISGVRDWNFDPSLAQWTGRLSSALLAACVVSLLEEFLFRGAVYTALRRVHGFLIATILSSLLYAFVHFFNRPPQPETVHVWSGFLTLGAMLRGFVSLEMLIPGWINLLIAGCLLAVAREQTGHLSWSIGLHAGWIFWLKIYGFATHPSDDVTHVWIGSGRLIDGWLATIVLGTALTWRLRSHRKPLSRESPT